MSKTLLARDVYNSKNIERDYREGLHLILSNLEAIATCRRETGKRKKKENVIDTDECKLHLDRKRSENYYLEALTLTQRNAEIIATPKWQMENAVDINAENDSDGTCSDDTEGETDLQYKYFLANLEEHGNSYALKVENNRVSSLLLYEEEFSSDDASEFEGRKRKMANVRPKDVLYSQKLGFLNNTKSVSKRQKLCECSRNVMNLPVREDAGRSENEISVRKRYAELLMKNQVKSRSRVTRKNIEKGNVGACSKAMAQIEYGHAHMTSDQSASQNRTKGSEIQKVANRMTVIKSRVTRKNIEMGNIGACSKAMAQIEYGHAHMTSDQSGFQNRTKGPEKLQKVAKRMRVAKSDYEAKRKYGQKKILLSGITVKCENETPAEKEKIQRKNSTKTAKGKNVVNQDHEVNRKEMTMENETHLSLKSSANNSVKGVPKKNVAEANNKVVVQIGKQLFYRKPGFGNNGVNESFKDKAHADNEKTRNCGKKSKGIDKRVNVVSGAHKNSSIPIEQYLPVKTAVKSKGGLKKIVKEEKVVNENNTISAQKAPLRKRGRPRKQIDNSRQNKVEKFLDKSHDGNNQENEVEDGVSSDVEILENVEVITDLFTEEDIERMLRVDMDTEYAKNLMSILKRPFDNMEYKRLSGCVQIYYKTHPSLKRKMIKYRYKTAKRLNILRGFFYWLEHCIAEGAFKPWEEKKCLAVETESN